MRGLKVVDVTRTAEGFAPVPGTEREIPAQLVVLALGFLGPQREGLLEQLGVALDERGNVQRGPDYATSVPKYILERRLERAHAQLTGPFDASVTIADIALSCGFSSASSSTCGSSIRSA